MEKSAKISNLRISNRMFAKFLEEKKLVIPTDNLIEITDSIADSASIFMSNKYPVNIILHSMNPNSLGVVFEQPENGVCNFMCNGDFSCASNYAKQMLDKGAFNIGICSQNSKEYKKSRNFYQKFGRELLAIGVPLEIYNEEIVDEELGNGKIYLLSYRAKK